MAPSPGSRRPEAGPSSRRPLRTTSFRNRMARCSCSPITATGTVAWLIHPPEDRIADSVLLPRVTKSIRTPAGDRVYFPVDSGLVGVRGRDLQIVPSLKLPKRPRAVVTSPSGDRIYVAADSSNELLVVDRYTGNITTRVTLPSSASALRMDPMGRYVLARASEGDTAYVISVSTDRLIGETPTQWRADLPAVAPNGWLALVRGKDVVLVDAESLATKRAIVGGAADDWMFIELEWLPTARRESRSARDVRVERLGAARHVGESVLGRHAKSRGRHARERHGENDGERARRAGAIRHGSGSARCAASRARHLPTRRPSRVASRCSSQRCARRTPPTTC